MATYNGLNSTKRDVTVPATKIDGVDNGGRVRFKYDEFTLTAALSTNDLINVMKMGPGERILDAIITFPDMDSSTTATVDLGWAASAEATPLEAATPQGCFAAVDAHTAAGAKSMNAVGGTVVGIMKKFASEVQMQIKIHAAGDATSGTIKVGIWYSKE